MESSVKHPVFVYTDGVSGGWKFCNIHNICALYHSIYSNDKSAYRGLSLQLETIIILSDSGR